MATQRRQYTKRQKAAAVAAAMATSATAAAEASGVPRTTLQYWMESPEFVALRQKTREDLAEEARVVAHLALAEVQKRLPTMDGRDAAIAFGILIDKAQLLAGQATSRAETRDLTRTMDDHERQALAESIDAWLSEREPA